MQQTMQAERERLCRNKTKKKPQNKNTKTQQHNPKS